MFTEWIASQVGDDPDLLAKVVPDYPATGKRTLQDNGSWLRTLTRDNVELVRTGIDHIEPDAIVDRRRRPARGRRDRLRHRLPRQPRSLCPMEIIGRDGADLRDAVGRSARRVPRHHRARASRTSSACTGPGTNLAHGGSLIFHSECQMRYITRVPRRSSIDGGLRAMEPRQDGYDDWHERIQAELETLVWSHPSIEHSFYKNADGEIHGLSPWRLVDYWDWTREPDLGRLRAGVSGDRPRRPTAATGCSTPPSAACADRASGGRRSVEIAQEAGVSRAWLYRHFPDKASLVVATLGRTDERFWAEAHAACPRPPRARRPRSRPRCELVARAAARRAASSSLKQDEPADFAEMVGTGLAELMPGMALLLARATSRPRVPLARCAPTSTSPVPRSG